MSKEYNLKFHEALKRAVEEDLIIEAGQNSYSKNTIFTSARPIRDFLILDWRVIEKPKRVEFECEWKKSEFSSQTTVKDENGFLDEASKFIGKRTRVIIEEIL